jgi:hypothetical protein
MGKLKSKYAKGVDDLYIDKSLNDAESERMLKVNTPKKSLKSQYEENKGGYQRALASGKKDSKGNVIDPKTGLTYKVLNKTNNSNTPNKILSKTTETIIKDIPKQKVSLAPIKQASVNEITTNQLLKGENEKRAWELWPNANDPKNKNKYPVNTIFNSLSNKILPKVSTIISKKDTSMGPFKKQSKDNTVTVEAKRNPIPLAKLGPGAFNKNPNYIIPQFTIGPKRK